MSLLLFAKTNFAAASEIQYGIDTMTGIDTGATTATVDTIKKQIRLPIIMPANMADFVGNGFEYMVLTPSGIEKYNTSSNALESIGISGTQPVVNNITAIAGTGSNSMDFVVATSTQITHYSYNGSGYVANPALSSTGYTNVISVGTKDNDTAALDASGSTYGLNYQAFNGSSMVTNPALSIAKNNISNPIATTLFKDTYGEAVLDGNTIKYYKNGNSVTATITGLSNALSVSASDGGNMAVVTANQVIHYNLVDSTFVENSALSITSGLTAPSCVALRPGSYDCIVVDGNQIKYYLWDGSSLVYDASLTQTVSNLQSLGKYAASAVVVSSAYSISAEEVKLSISPSLQTQSAGTSIAWYVTAQSDDSNWEQATLGTWTILKDPGSSVRWKAILATTDNTVTPIINPTIVLDTNVKPTAPTINVPPTSGADSCYWNATPKIRWTFNDPDSGDTQGAYEIIVSGGSMTDIDSGVVTSSASSYTVENSTALYNSGVNVFNVTIKVWDAVGKATGTRASDAATSKSSFCITAFSNPYVALTVPASGSLYAGYILHGALPAQLVTTQAGGLVTLTVQSIGLTSAVFTFPYTTSSTLYQSTIAGTPTSTSGTNKTWTISFYTDANTTICPNGTIINGYFTGDGRSNLMYFDSSSPGTEPTTGDWWEWAGFRQWSSGVVSVGNSIFDKWYVVLNGSQH